MIKRIGEKPNGCGCASGWLKWFRPPYGILFSECCEMHDILYNLGGSEEDRKEADKSLYIDMVKLSLEFKPLKSMWLAVIAYLYYLCVRLFGKRYFNYTTNAIPFKKLF